MNAGLFDPRKGHEAVTAERMAFGREPYEPARSNYFTVYWIASGAGTVWADTAAHSFGPKTLLFAGPYQRIRFAATRPVRGEAIRFHANFLCVETFHAETGCSGALFNDPFGSPLVALDRQAKVEVPALVDRIHREQTERAVGYAEALLAYLKILLIVATRLKGERAGTRGKAGDPRDHVLERVKDLVEQNYRALHAPSDYATLLHVTPKALTHFVRTSLGKTMTDLIRERILVHAKWDLLHTLKPVKEIAGELGFGDELYFSRFFKKSTGQSPSHFREFETAIRNGSNLSMSFVHPPIPRVPVRG